MKKVFIFLLLIYSFTLKANPNPFDLEIGKATISELKKKHKTKFIDKNIYSNGDMYSLDVNSINIDGLEKATAIFSQEKKLVAILTTFPKYKFEYLYGVINKKYKLSKKNISFVGNKSAEFKEGDSTIFLDAPHLDFKMSMNYVNNEFWNTYQNKLKEDLQEKNQNDQSTL